LLVNVRGFAGRRAERRHIDDISQQTGRRGLYERHRDTPGSRVGRVEKPNVPNIQNVGQKRYRARRSDGLALQHSAEPQINRDHDVSIVNCTKFVNSVLYNYGPPSPLLFRKRCCSFYCVKPAAKFEAVLSRLLLRSNY